MCPLEPSVVRDVLHVSMPHLKLYLTYIQMIFCSQEVESLVPSIGLLHHMLGNDLV